MIKFFKRTRKQLLEHDRIQRYTVYAIGEILLVMIGILLALGVNNWYKNRNENSLEREYLALLQQDIQSDIQNIKNIRARSVDRIIEPMERVLMILFQENTTDFDTLQFYQDIQKAMRINIVPLRKGTYEDLMSTGNIKLISNSLFRNELHNYIEKSRYYEFYYNGMLQGLYSADRTIGALIPYRNSKIIELGDDFPIQNRPFDLEQVLSSVAIENAIITQLFTAKWIDNSFADLLEKAQHIDSQLTEMLKK